MSNNNSSAFTRGYFHPIWWAISWVKHCSIGRKISAFLLLIPVVSVCYLMMTRGISRVSSGEVAIFSFIIFFSLYLLLVIWPFMLVIAPPRVTRKDVTCCSGCGKIDQSLRYVEYTIGFCLLGLIPIQGGYKRILCSTCRRFVYRLAVVIENIVSMIGFPVGTVLGLVWAVKNLRSKVIQKAESRNILNELDKFAENRNDLKAQKQITIAINSIKVDGN